MDSSRESFPGIFQEELIFMQNDVLNAMLNKQNSDRMLIIEFIIIKFNVLFIRIAFC